MLRLGSSKEWPVALEAITGSRNMSVEPLIEYFQPLMNWLIEYNSKHGHSSDQWDDECPSDIPEVITCKYIVTQLTETLYFDRFIISCFLLPCNCVLFVDFWQAALFQLSVILLFSELFELYFCAFAGLYVTARLA